MSERRLVGKAAAPGLFSGPLQSLRAVATQRAATGDPAREAASLRKALAEAARQLSVLAERIGGNSADILGFQIALVGDEALSEGAFQAIETGAAADAAWRAAMDAEIADYVSAGDSTHGARAADLIDLRNRVLGILSGAQETQRLPSGTVIVADDLSPSYFLTHDWSKGGAILLSEGSPTSHVAILARARGIPMIVGLPIERSWSGLEALVDGSGGEAIVEPNERSRAAFESKTRIEAERDQRAKSLTTAQAKTADGVAIAVQVNISDLAELEGLDPAICDGVGLVRTEFLFHGGRLPDEDTQFRAYRRLAEWCAGKPVTIRTLDAGGDKPIPGLTIDGESNPFLGVRGIRLSLARPEVFRIQIRALLRAAHYGPIKIMLPMVTVPREIDAARNLIDEELVSLRQSGVAVKPLPIGMMVEVPAAAAAIEDFASDFYSIGSNDLTQYATAAGRDIAAVADLADPLHPGVLRLIAMVTRHGRAIGREVSLCGEAGSDAASIAPLLRAGLRTLSVTPAAVGRVKLAIAAVTLGDSAGGLAA